MDHGLTQDGEADLEWPEDICTACNVVADCEDCQAATQYCTEDCFVQDEACQECEPCFDEACCFADETSYSMACDLTDPCCAAAAVAASTHCTLEDCTGPTPYDHMATEFANMHDYAKGCHYNGNVLHQCNVMSGDWQKQLSHIGNNHTGTIFHDYCPTAHDHTSHSAVPSLSHASSVSDPSDASELSRRGSACIESSMAIAEGMRSLYTCHADDCQESFYDYMQLDQHVLSNHLSHGLPSHQYSKHPAVPLAIQTLEPRSDLNASLTNSTNSHHLCKWLVSDESGKQRQCGMCFATTQELTQHLKQEHVGTRRKEYVCRWADCNRHGKPFAQRQKIDKHLVVHTHDRPFKCSRCDYVASDDASLRQHARTHTGEKPFDCPICHKTFSASTSVSMHMRIHTGEKPLVCKWPGCGKRFSESSNMTKHMRTHALGKEFACDVEGCEKRFQRSDQLKRHKRTVHRQLSDKSCCRPPVVPALVPA